MMILSVGTGSTPRLGPTWLNPDRTIFGIAQSIAGEVEIYLNLGDLQTAIEYAQKSIDILRPLAAKETDNVQAQIDLSVSLRSSGDVLRAQGNHPSALEAYRAGLQIDRKAAAEEPEKLHDLVPADPAKIGQILLAQGDLKGALSSFQESLDLERKLSSKLDIVWWQQGVAIGLSNIGDLLRAQGNLADALTAYRDSLDISRKLAAKSPDFTPLQEGLSILRGRIGDVLSAQSDHTGALAAYREEVEVRP